MLDKSSINEISSESNIGVFENWHDKINEAFNSCISWLFFNINMIFIGTISNHIKHTKCN